MILLQTPEKGLRVDGLLMKYNLSGSGRLSQESFSWKALDATKLMRYLSHSCEAIISHPPDATTTPMIDDYITVFLITTEAHPFSHPYNRPVVNSIFLSRANRCSWEDAA